MTEAPVNRYIAGNPVTGEEMFFGREDVFDFVRRALIGRHQDNVVVLYGQRRTGKTSILYQMRRHIDARYIPVLLDLQALTMDGVATFLWEIAVSICRTLRRDLEIVVERPARGDFASDPLEYFDSIFLAKVWEAVGDRHLLLMFDESVRLEDQVLAGKLEPEVFGYVRHLVQHNPRLNFIFSIGSRLEEMQREYSVLFNVALYKKISFLEPEAGRQLITQPVKGIFEYEDQAVEYILEEGGRHAYYTQLICHSLFTRWEQTRSPRMTVEDVRAVLPEAVERGAANLKFVWDQANTVEKLVLAAMAEQMEERNRPLTENEIRRVLEERQIYLSRTAINAALAALFAKEIVISEGNAYQFSVDLLRLYLREQHKMEWVQAELAEALEEMQKAGALGAGAAERGARLRVFAVVALLSIIVAALGSLLIPASPLSLFAAKQAPIVITLPTPTPTATPTPTPVPTPTPTPIPPEAGLYTFNRCGMDRPMGPGLEQARLKLCVESVDVDARGDMKFNVSWTAEILKGLIVGGQLVNVLKKEPDVGNTNMYITDDRGNRYNFIDLGGAAKEPTDIPNGEKALGWFLFPAPKADARLFTFHDDDNFWSISGILLVR